MAIKNLITKLGRGRERLPQRREEVDDPFHSFQRDMNRLFDNFFAGFPLATREATGDFGLSTFSPRVNVSENDKEVTVSAELPGIDEKDITVEMNDSAVTIRGEKKKEQEEKGKNWYRMEQSYGFFHRSIPLPASFDGAKAKAQFKKGLLTIAIPKREEKQGKRKTITIEAE
jgi:HSP20 family protein